MHNYLVRIGKIFFSICLCALMLGCGNQTKSPESVKVVSQKIVTAKDNASGSEKPKASRNLASDAGTRVSKKAAQISSAKNKDHAPEKTVTAGISAVVPEKDFLITKTVYNPEGKIDPFAPLFRDEPVATPVKKEKEKRIPVGPLEKVELSQLKLVAVVRAASGNRAMVEDASGKGFIVNKGTYIGTHSGRVAKIDKDRLIVEEEHEELTGKISIRNRELKLQKPLGEE